MKVNVTPNAQEELKKSLTEQAGDFIRILIKGFG